VSRVDTAANGSGPWGNNELPSAPTASRESACPPVRSRKDLAMGLSLLGLVLGLGEGDLIHLGNESYTVDNGRIVAGFWGVRVSLIA